MTPFDLPHVYRPGSSTDGITLILLHGTGGDENDLLPLGHDLLPEAALLSPRGQVSEANGALRFFRRSAMGVLDLADWRLRTHQLADFILEASRRYSLDLRRAVTVGLSNGANIATGLLLLRPEVISRAVLWRPMFVTEVSPQPLLHGKSVLIHAGAVDPLLRPGETARLEAQFRTAGAAVTVHLQEAGHNLVPSDITQTREWLQAAEQDR